MEPTQDPHPSARAYVPVPEGYLALDDGAAAGYDEALADEILRQLGIDDD